MKPHATRFLVEIDRADIRAVQTLTDEARGAARALRGRGVDVRFLRAVVVPEDGSCYLLWEAESRDALMEAMRSLGHEAPHVVAGARWPADLTGPDR